MASSLREGSISLLTNAVSRCTHTHSAFSVSCPIFGKAGLFRNLSCKCSQNKKLGVFQDWRCVGTHAWEGEGSRSAAGSSRIGPQLDIKFGLFFSAYKEQDEEGRSKPCRRDKVPARLIPRRRGVSSSSSEASNEVSYRNASYIFPFSEDEFLQGYWCGYGAGRQGTLDREEAKRMLLVLYVCIYWRLLGHRDERGMPWSNRRISSTFSLAVKQSAHTLVMTMRHGQFHHAACFSWLPQCWWPARMRASKKTIYENLRVSPVCMCVTHQMSLQIAWSAKGGDTDPTAYINGIKLAIVLTTILSICFLVRDKQLQPWTLDESIELNAPAHSIFVRTHAQAI